MLAVAVIVVLTACGSSGPTWQTPQDVTTYLQKQIQASVSFDPNRETAKSSVLKNSDDSMGSYSIFVFKKGNDPTDYTIGKTQVPAIGEVTWGPWKALDAKLLPGEGIYDLLKTYKPNVVLSYSVDAKKGHGHPSIPGGLRLLDETLSSFTGTTPGIA